MYLYHTLLSYSYTSVVLLTVGSMSGCCLLTQLSRGLLLPTPAILSTSTAAAKLTDLNTNQIFRAFTDTERLKCSGQQHCFQDRKL